MTTLPKDSPAIDPPVHQPTTRGSSGMTSEPSRCSPTAGTGAACPSGSTRRVGRNGGGMTSYVGPTLAAGASGGLAPCPESTDGATTRAGCRTVPPGADEDDVAAASEGDPCMRP